MMADFHEPQLTEREWRITETILAGLTTTVVLALMDSEQRDINDWATDEEQAQCTALAERLYRVIDAWRDRCAPWRGIADESPREGATHDAE